jgi:hypothetical protein
VGERRWTLAAAREILPDVRARTERAVRATEELVAQRDLHEEGSRGRERVEARIQQEVGRWAREMEALGVEVKGVWLVDFDTGGGYYCWRWPEAALEYFHTYEQGFAGRSRIQ